MTPSPLAARLREESERTLSAEEVRTYLATPISAREREDVLSLVRWFRLRYPEPRDRLAYIRRAYARWQRTQQYLSE
jgi:hypothetical protein